MTIHQQDMSIVEPKSLGQSPHALKYQVHDAHERNQLK